MHEQREEAGTTAEIGSPPRRQGKRTSAGLYLKAALGILLVALLVTFVVQNATSIHVKFLSWEADLPQALVVFMALLSGVVFGVAFNRWQRWRSSRISGGR